MNIFRFQRSNKSGTSSVLLKNTYILFFCISIAIQGVVVGQSINAEIVDSTTKQGIPFVCLKNSQSHTVKLTDQKGYFIVELLEEIEISHPLYETKSETIDHHDSIFTIELTKKNEIEPTQKQLDQGKNIIESYHRNLPQTSTTKLPEFEFLSQTRFEVFQQSRENHEEWTLLSSMESIEKNKFKSPDRKYMRVVSARYEDGDSSKIGFVPINSYSTSENNEYINVLNLKFYNPLYNGAERRYDYALLDSIQREEGTIQVIYFRPKPSRRFIGFAGVLYFTVDRSANWGGFLFPFKKNMEDFTIAYYQALTSKNTRFTKDLHVVFRLKNIPNFNMNSQVIFSSKNTLPNFDIKNTSNSKWVDMALFDQEKDTTNDDTWMMTQVVDKDKLEYIKKDTLDKQFVLSNTLKQMYNIYDGKIGYRVRFFDINNVFSINKFESVRIGIGLQSHENFSDVFTFGGYVGYGFKDGEFKYGSNVGLYIGPKRNHLFSIKYTKDLLEPGRVNFMDKKQDLVKDFFTSRMDDYQSTQVLLRTRINAFFTSSLVLNNYSLKPLYEYIYNPNGQDLTDTQEFNFTETSILFNIGTPFSDNPNLRNLLLRKKRLKANVFLNVTKGFDTEPGGDFDYLKLNARLSSNIRINLHDELDAVIEGGIMTLDQPYPIMYGGPGTEFKLTGIIINNAFQTMKLYGFFTDRYAHSFINYNFGNVIFKKSKFKPELALALNIGWGKIIGQKDIHELIEVRDYSNGYYEAGVMLNNLLRLKIYKYFYGGLGVGTYIGFGPDAEGGAFAIRVSYEIGTL